MMRMEQCILAMSARPMGCLLAKAAHKKLYFLDKIVVE